MDRQALIRRLEEIVGPQGVISERNQLRTYECDGLANFRVIPSVVVLPETASQAQGTVRACYEAGVPFVARGSGTGLSGGALPVSDGVLVVLARMRRVHEVDLDNQRAVVEPGVLNLQVTKEVAPEGFYYAPDPSSQQVCSIGGNVAENSGGAHCLKYGFTTNHVTGLEIVTPAGDLVRLGGRAPDPPGYDLVGAFVGSKGTLGIATEVTVRLVRLPEAVQTLLAGFASTDEAGAAVSAIIGAGVVPAAIEMMDALAIEAAEAAVHCGYPDGAGAVLIVELDGSAAEVDAQFDDVKRLCREAGAFEIRVAADDAQRALFWKGRKSAFAAVGRISPDYIVQDGVIPAPRCRRCCAASPTSRAAPASGWPTSSTPATATCTPLCSSTTPWRASPSGPRRSPARSSTCASSTVARSPASAAWAWTRSATCRACSAPTTLTPCSSCGAPSIRPGWPTRARSSRRRGCAARCRAGTAGRTRCRRPASRRCSERGCAGGFARRVRRCPSGWRR